MEKIILISGKAGHGKDTLAEAITSQMILNGKKVATTRYATHIKRILSDFYNWNGIKTDWARNKLQLLGTEIIREKLNKPDFHVSRTCEDIEIVQDDFDYILIPDTRFPNEIEYVKEKFGTDKVMTIRVERLNYKSELSEEAQKHKSETLLDNYDEWDYISKSTNLRDVVDNTRKICKMLGVM